MGTDRLGLFTALNEQAGQGARRGRRRLTDGGALTSFGTFDAFVYPNTVSVVNVNGGKGKR